MTATEGRIKPQSISDDVRAIEEALAAGPTQGPWRNIVNQLGTSFLIFANGRMLVCDMSWHAHVRKDYPLRQESEANAKHIAACDPARLRRVLDTMQAMGEALTLAEDVLARFPFSTEIWPNGTHPNAGITQIRDALALYEGKQ